MTPQTGITGLIVAGAVALVAALSNHNIGQPTGMVGQATVTDGDSLRLNGHRIRLFGIDAPELDQLCTLTTGEPWSCGVESRDMLIRFVGAEEVTCQHQDIDRYERIVATCTVRGQDIGREMVVQGMAVAYRQYSLRYVAAEMQAQRELRGMWSGTFVRPDEWRRRAR